MKLSIFEKKFIRKINYFSKIYRSVGSLSFGKFFINMTHCGCYYYYKYSCLLIFSEALNDSFEDPNYDPFKDIEELNDDSFEDPDYDPSKDMPKEVYQFSDTELDENPEKHTQEELLNLLIPRNTKEVPISRIPVSEVKGKKHFCLYCHKLFSQLPRHLEIKHADEEDVKQCKILPKGIIIYFL